MTGPRGIAAISNRVPIHIAIDLETYARTPDALVLSVGLVAFNRQGVVATFYTTVNNDEQKQMGRTVEPETVAWWNQQSAGSRAALREPDPTPSVKETMRAIDLFFHRFDTTSYDIAGVWGYGSDFDNVILASLFKSAGYASPPWPYKANRCGRTLVKMLNLRIARSGSMHHALDDAKWLASIVSVGLDRLDGFRLPA